MFGMTAIFISTAIISSNRRTMTRILIMRKTSLTSEMCLPTLRSTWTRLSSTRGRFFVHSFQQSPNLVCDSRFEEVASPPAKGGKRAREDEEMADLSVASGKYRRFV